MTRTDRCSIEERKAMTDAAGIPTLDPKNHQDWEVAFDAEKRMKTVYELGDDLGLKNAELLPYGHYMGKIDFMPVMDRLQAEVVPSAFLLPSTPWDLPATSTRL